jgi:hypothetical protein
VLADEPSWEMLLTLIPYPLPAEDMLANAK